MAVHCGRCACLKDRRLRGVCTCAFGLGLSLSCFCPHGLVLFIAALIIAAMGINLLIH